LRKANSFLCHAIDIRRFDLLLSVAGEIRVTHVVDEDEKEVWALGSQDGRGQ
jgi:hypothetical protein